MPNALKERGNSHSAAQVPLTTGTSFWLGKLGWEGGGGEGRIKIAASGLVHIRGSEHGSKPFHGCTRAHEPRKASETAEEASSGGKFRVCSTPGLPGASAQNWRGSHPGNRRTEKVGSKRPWLSQQRFAGIPETTSFRVFQLLQLGGCMGGRGRVGLAPSVGSGDASSDLSSSLRGQGRKG